MTTGNTSKQNYMYEIVYCKRFIEIKFQILVLVTFHVSVEVILVSGSVTTGITFEVVLGWFFPSPSLIT